MAPADLIAFDAAHGDVVCGADEAGRACFAGPLVAAALRLRPAGLDAQSLAALARLNDSKKLSATARAELYPVVLGAAQSVAICLRYARTIDERGLHVCNLEANRCALARVAVPRAALLADGFALAPIAGCDVVHVVGGDHFSAAIAAASIIAKVTRDRLMGRLAVCHPGYGFERHAGYGTKDHERAITNLGLCDQHRRSIKRPAELAAQANRTASAEAGRGPHSRRTPRNSQRLSANGRPSPPRLVTPSSRRVTCTLTRAAAHRGCAPIDTGWPRPFAAQIVVALTGTRVGDSRLLPAFGRLGWLAGMRR